MLRLGRSRALFALALIVIIMAAGAAMFLRPLYSQPERTNVLTPDDEAGLALLESPAGELAFAVARGEPELTVMDFSQPMPLDPLPDGWWHRHFLTRSPMALSFAWKEGRHALRLETDDSASMLFRYVDVELERYPLLAWEWYVEEPIDSTVDERTREGDDHPARLYISFRTDGGEQRSMEIIWGNRLGAGEYKYIGDFPHYVANGGDANIGEWHDEQVNLLEIYREIWGADAGTPRITDIALFCDSDETGGSSIAYFASVSLRQQADVPPGQ